jgi:arylsulfatase A-like enzyme
MCPPGEWFDRHAPADMALPPTVDDPLTDAPEYLRRLSRIHPSEQRFWVMPCGVAGDHDLVRAAIAATYGMVEMIDDRIGRILAAVERAGQLDNTIVVFTADHGDMMGDHGLMLKGRMHYRGTLQVPMVIVDPRRAPGRTTSLAGSIDLASTLLDLAGLSSYDGMQGTSLVPILDDPAATVRSELLIEDDYPKALAAHRNTIAKTRTLVTEHHKYTRHDSGEDQLYDLDADPDELTHLGAARPEVRAELIERLADAVIDAADDARGTPLATSSG